jgi:hypothetical protein
MGFEINNIQVKNNKIISEIIDNTIEFDKEIINRSNENCEFLD